MDLPQRRNESQLNRAYGCFAFLGLVTLPFGLAALLQTLGLMYLDEGSGGLGEALSGWAYYWGILLGGPILLGMLAATAYGIVRTVQFRHLALEVLSVNAIVCGGGTMLLIFAADNASQPLLDYVIGIGFATYITANLLIPAWWFTTGRRRYRMKAPLRNKLPLRSDGAQTQEQVMRSTRLSKSDHYANGNRVAVMRAFLQPPGSFGD